MGVAIILARGGSKGVRRKNARQIGGRACVEWTIDHALAARRVGVVALSTDDPELMEIARGRGVEVVARPGELAGDSARVDDAARHAAVTLAERRVCARGSPLAALYGNVPVRPVGCIDLALQTLEETGADSVQSYQGVGKFHPWWTARVDDAGKVSPWEGNVLNHGVFRRQDLPAAFIPDGAVMALSWRALMLEVGAPPGPHAFFGVDRRGIVNPEGSVVDIDSELDVLVAEAMLGGLSSGPNRDREGAGSPRAYPNAYCITFRTFGSWLPGDARGTVQASRNEFGGPSLPENRLIHDYAQRQLTGEAVTLDAAGAAIVERTIGEVCAHRSWQPHAVHARSTHVHVVVSAPLEPERVMNDLKSWCSRRLVEHGWAKPGANVWARHGSTRYLWSHDDVVRAVDYVMNRQGPRLGGEAT